MHIKAASIVTLARRLAGVILVTAACIPACRADFETAYKAYLSGNKAALSDDLQAIAASGRVEEFEVWRLAMWQKTIGAPPSIRGVASEDTQKALQILASGLHQGKQADSLVKLVYLMQQFGYEEDVYKTYELAAQLDHVPAIIQLVGAARRRGDLATELALNERAATLGDLQAMYRTGCAYMGDLNADERRNQFRIPSGSYPVNFGCARFHKNPDEKKAFEWFRRAALTQFGNETSEYLGWLYLRGIGTAVNYEKAFQSFMLSARYAHPELGNRACFGSIAIALEEMFRLGLGTEKSERQAEYFKNRQICMPPPVTK